MRAPDPLIERQTLEKLERLALRWQTSFIGLLGGHNRSRFAGTGQEFLDHRHFHPGDDLRSVNWLAYMRLERLFLKMFQIEPRVPVRIFLDTSESMACGASSGAGEPKFHYACRLAAMLSYIGLVKLDTIILQPFSDRLAESYTAQGGRHRLAPALRFLGGLETGAPSDFAAVVRQFLSVDPRPGLTIILSDFLDPNENGCEDSLQHMADYGQELLLAHLAGPDDRTPAWRGDWELVDAESGETRRLELDQRAVDAHQSAYDDYCARLHHLALRNRGRYVPLGTDLPLTEAIFGPVVGSGGIAVSRSS